MKYKFEAKTIGDCCDIIKKSIHPEKGQVYTCFSLPAFDNSNTPEILNGEEIKSSKFVLDENTILFNKLNPKFRRVWNIHSLEKYENTICSTEFLPLKAKANIEQDYLYYYVSSPYFTRLMDGIRTGTSNSQQRIDWKQFLREPINVPSLPIQRKVVSLLRNIDKKIELNNAINNNLEQQAKAIFSNEFLTLETLPDGWKQASLIDIADYLNGLAMQKYRPTADETGIPVLKIKELRQGCCDDNSELCSPSIKSEYIIHDGDVIFSWSGSLLVDFWCGGICGLNQHLFKVTSNKYNKWFYYAWTKHHLDRFIAVAADKATTMGHIKRDELSKAEVLIPNEADYKRIETLLQPIYDLIIANRIENKKLAETRDTLLPKLMTGEIDITEVDYE